jgi:hypothetical protein
MKVVFTILLAGILDFKPFQDQTGFLHQVKTKHHFSSQLVEDIFQITLRDQDILTGDKDYIILSNSNDTIYTETLPVHFKIEATHHFQPEQ